MPVTVKLPAPLRPLAQNQSEVVVEATSTVGAAVAELTARFPALKDRLLDDKGALRRYINVFRNEEDIRAAGGLGASLKDGDKLAVVPAIAGGLR